MIACVKRIVLFLALNVCIILTISFLVQVLGIQPYFTHRYGINYTHLLAFCFIWGMAGAFISLALSRIMAKWMLGVQVIHPMTKNPKLQELVQKVHHLARSAHLPVMPEVGIYSSPEVNAFATGPMRSRALVAVSQGLLERMTPNEIEGVLGHEVSHIANGDMITMTLLQGVVNAFVMFFARVLAFVLAQFMRGDAERERRSSFSLVYGLQMVLEFIFLILGSMLVSWYSRYREYRADAGGARLAGRENMIQALEKLRLTIEGLDPSAQPTLQILKISHRRLALFSTHPPLEDRIARIKKLANS